MCTVIVEAIQPFINKCFLKPAVKTAMLAFEVKGQNLSRKEYK